MGATCVWTTKYPWLRTFRPETFCGIHHIYDLPQPDLVSTNDLDVQLPLARINLHGLTELFDSGFCSTKRLIGENNMKTILIAALVLVICPFAFVVQLDAQEKDQEKKDSKVPAALEVYKGRRIAQTMHYLGAEWLIRDEREREERCSMMIANLGVKTGMTICDMGCGNGFHTLRLAEMTGEHGSVLGVDVQPEMLGFLRERMETDGVENVIPILGSYHNPRLPPNTVDLILMVDVYHEFSHPEQMLAAMRNSLKEDGLIVLVEYRAEDPDVPIKKLHKMSKEQIDIEMEANGFSLAKEFDKLPWQHMMFYGKAEDSDDEDAAKDLDDK